MALAAGCGSGAPPERIVLIVVDTLRRDRLSPYGGALPTPHVQALADRGQVFTHVLASFHQTSMSMGALFTGRTPSLESDVPGEALPWNGRSWCGLARFGDAGSACVPAGLETLAERLRGAGYWTIGVASNDLLYDPAGYSAGFDDWVELGREARDSTRPALVRWPAVNRAAEAALARRPRDRFFLYVHYMDVHNYYLDREPYDATVARVDRALGELLAALDEAGLRDGALVVLTSDHGEHLDEERPAHSSRRHIGNPSFQEVLRIPLVIAPPVAADPEGFLRSEDLHHLIARAAGVPSEPGRGVPPAELFVSEQRFRTFIDGRWKLILQRGGLRHHLFDLERDPGEQHDLSRSDPETVRRLYDRVVEVSAGLSGGAVDGALSAEDRRRLEALGYLEE